MKTTYRALSMLLSAAMVCSMAATAASAEDIVISATAAEAPAATAESAPAPELTPAPSPTPVAAPEEPPLEVAEAELAADTYATDYGSGVDGFVTRLYSVCLGREPDAAGKADWVGRLTSYNISGSRAAYGFVFSEEFANKGYSNADFVEHLYAAFMGRASDEGGKADWVGRLDAGTSREDVFYGFANSAEFDNICNSYGIVAKDIETFVTRLYSVCLDRQPDEAGLADWCNALRSGSKTGTEVAAGFIASQEFLNKNYCNEHYVDYLYRAFFGREPDAAGKADWVGRLDSGATRGSIFNGFTGSAEFSNLCASFGIVRGEADYSNDAWTPTGACSICGKTTAPPANATPTPTPKPGDRILYCTLTYDPNGGTLSAGTSSTETLYIYKKPGYEVAYSCWDQNIYGEVLNYPWPEREGKYVFQGWYTEREGGQCVLTAEGKKSDDCKSIKFYGDTTLYAHWWASDWQASEADIQEAVHASWEYDSLRLSYGRGGNGKSLIKVTDEAELLNLNDQEINRQGASNRFYWQMTAKICNTSWFESAEELTTYLKNYCYLDENCDSYFWPLNEVTADGKDYGGAYLNLSPLGAGFFAHMQCQDGSSNIYWVQAYSAPYSGTNVYWNDLPYTEAYLAARGDGINHWWKSEGGSYACLATDGEIYQRWKPVRNTIPAISRDLVDQNSYFEYKK